MPTERWLIALHLSAVVTFVHALGNQYATFVAASSSAKYKVPFMYGACIPAMTVPIYMLQMKQYYVLASALCATLLTVLLLPAKPAQRGIVTAAYCVGMAALSIALYFVAESSRYEPLVAYVGAVSVGASATLVKPQWAEYASILVSAAPNYASVVAGVAVLGIAWLSHLDNGDDIWFVAAPSASAGSLLLLGLLVGL